MKTEISEIIPVLPSADIARDIAWYKEKAGFETKFPDNMYAVLCRDNSYIHLQWHAIIKVVKEYPEVAVFKRTAGYVNQVKTIKRIDVPGKDF